MTVGEYEDKLPSVEVRFFFSGTTTTATLADDPAITVDHVTAMHVRILPVVDAEPDSLHDVTAYSWGKIIEQCAKDDRFETLQWFFPTLDFLKHFMTTWREALTKLGDRNFLAYDHDDDDPQGHWIEFQEALKWLDTQGAPY